MKSILLALTLIVAAMAAPEYKPAIESADTVIGITNVNTNANADCAKCQRDWEECLKVRLYLTISLCSH